MWKKTQTNCTLIASDFVIYPKILIFSVFKIANLSHFSRHCCFTYLFLRSICGIGNSSLQYLRRRQDFDNKKFVFDGVGYTAKRLTDEFPYVCVCISLVKLV